VCENRVITVTPPPPPPSDGTGGGDAAASAPPKQDISTADLTPALRRIVEESGLVWGTATVVSRHTTTAVAINELESRLAGDLQDFLLRLAPIDERSPHPLRQPGVRYRHNDLELRPESEEEFRRCLDNGWDVRDPQVLKNWRDQEPINAHSHLLAMLLGSTETVPVEDGALQIGAWQSVLLIDLDGPRTRTVGVHVQGYR
jgi:thiamine phosphate synthase YjbQ (UPF0047 family)